jgi:putative holliday junction resolvase
MKKLGIDLGDKWIGMAISDGLAITCRPYKTTTIEKLLPDLAEILREEPIDTVVIGLPITSKGTESEQTKKVRNQKESIEKEISTSISRTIKWVLWDERLSTKRAHTTLKQTKKKTAKKNPQQDHAIAAAFILQSFLDSNPSALDC